MFSNRDRSANLSYGNAMIRFGPWRRLAIGVYQRNTGELLIRVGRRWIVRDRQETWFKTRWEAIEAVECTYEVIAAAA